jgi:hypothetical protein
MPAAFPSANHGPHVHALVATRPARMDAAPGNPTERSVRLRVRNPRTPGRTAISTSDGLPQPLQLASLLVGKTPPLQHVGKHLSSTRCMDMLADLFEVLQLVWKVKVRFFPLLPREVRGPRRFYDFVEKNAQRFDHLLVLPVFEACIGSWLGCNSMAGAPGSSTEVGGTCVVTD